MPRVKKDKPLHMTPEVIAAANQRVADSPRGAPETIHEVEPVQWIDMPATPTVQRLAPRHALEEAPNGSKIVVSRTETGKVVRLLTPERTMELPFGDLCYTLPTGAKIRKSALGIYEAYRLGVQHEPVFSAGSVAEAVTKYLQLSD